MLNWKLSFCLWKQTRASTLPMTTSMCGLQHSSPFYFLRGPMGLNSSGLGGQWGAMDKVCSARGEGGLARHRQEWRKPPSGRRVRQHGVLHIVFSGKSPLWILCVHRRVANQSRFPRELAMKLLSAGLIRVTEIWLLEEGTRSSSSRGDAE